MRGMARENVTKKISNSALKLSFFGGAQEVTGACHLLDTGAARILIDCGLFQCPKFCERRNHDPFPFDPKTIDALFVTHGHIDHVGRIPKLVRDGFRGRIYSTHPTKEFAEIMLRDSLGVMEKEAEGRREKLVYDTEDIDKTVTLWEGLEYGAPFQVKNARVTLQNAGHILGSSLVRIEVAASLGPAIFVFTGDLGNSPMPLLMPSDTVTDAHYLIIESAYGDRLHEDMTTRKLKLERVIEDTARAGGTLMIPAFSLERTQELLYELNELVENDRIPRLPVFIDSPLAISATNVYRKYQSYFSPEARRLIRSGDDLFQFPGLEFTRSTDESKHINDIPPPKIILAGAGMMQGGRILHHARRYLPDSKSSILFVGYQVAGSLGRKISDGAMEVTLFGERVPVRAKVYDIGSYSAHADSGMLFDFVEHSRGTLQKVFVVQGEPKAALYLVQRIRDNLGIDAVAPRFCEGFELE